MTARRIEWPTLAVAAAVLGGWLAATGGHAALPGLALALVGGWLVAWHGSLQHETIHGHPTGWHGIDAAIGSVPLALWLPYAVYRRSHIAHHATPAITDPFDDPESRYLAWTSGRLARSAARVEATLIGRLLVGPLLTVMRFGAAEAVRAVREPGGWARDWVPHLIGVAAVLLWLDHVGLGIGQYLVCFVYPGTALTLLRSFVEHRADHDPARRVALVERAGPLALLYLHNNLHAAHHAAPGLPWYRLPAFHRAHRDRLVAENGGLVYRGYGEVVRRYLWRRHDTVVHPDHAA